MKLKFGSFCFATLIIAIASSAQTGKKMTDFLGVPGPLVFAKQRYNLSWSSHPAANYYKHEYLQKGENPDRFKSMVMLEVVTGSLNVKDVAGAKIAELKKMKEANPVVNYESFENPSTGETMIDFLVTANAPNGQINIAERNVYRYKTFSDAAGHKGVLLFAVSTRSYENETTAFIASLKSTRKEMTTAVSQFQVPAVKISK